MLPFQNETEKNIINFPFSLAAAMSPCEILFSSDRLEEIGRGNMHEGQQELTNQDRAKVAPGLQGAEFLPGQDCGWFFKSSYWRLGWEPTPLAFPWYHEFSSILNNPSSLDKLERILLYSEGTGLLSPTLWIFKMLEKAGQRNGLREKFFEKNMKDSELLSLPLWYWWEEVRGEILFSHIKPKERSFERTTWRTWHMFGVWPMTGSKAAETRCIRSKL